MFETDSSTSSPESTPPAEDAGAETQRRFRYQASYTAMLSLGLLDDAGPVEIYCEHHEDVVVRLGPTSFKALQLKTRMVGRAPFKTCDQEVRSALRRFAALEDRFPGYFQAYFLASNVGFWSDKKNQNNLRHALSDVRSSTVKPGKSLVEQIAEIKPPIDAAIVSATLKKVELLVTPGLDDIDSRLRENLAKTSLCRGLRYDQLKEVEDALRDRISAASSLAAAGELAEYIKICSSSVEAVQNQHVIQSKRIDKQQVLEVLNSKTSASALLRSHKQVPIDSLPRGMKTLEIKLAAGGLTVSAIEHLKDLKFSAETLLATWLYKYGPDDAQKYYEHFRVIVHGECLAAQQSSQTSDELYANQMLMELRQRLAIRTSGTESEIPECRQEHLLGMAGILTEDCTVWWTPEFQLPEARQ